MPPSLARGLTTSGRLGTHQSTTAQGSKKTSSPTPLPILADTTSSDLQHLPITSGPESFTPTLEDVVQQLTPQAFVPYEIGWSFGPSTRIRPNTSAPKSVGAKFFRCVEALTRDHCPCTACCVTQDWNAKTSVLPMGRMVTSPTVLISTSLRSIPKRASTWLRLQVRSVAPFRSFTISRVLTDMDTDRIPQQTPNAYDYKTWFASASLRSSRY